MTLNREDSHFTLIIYRHFTTTSGYGNTIKTDLELVFIGGRNLSLDRFIPPAVLGVSFQGENPIISGAERAGPCTFTAVHSQL